MSQNNYMNAWEYSCSDCAWIHETDEECGE
jgi:hypothetical protein